MQKKKADEILKYAIYRIYQNLLELYETANEYSSEFEYGEKTAYVECLEILSKWENSEIKNVEEFFPL